MKYTKKIFILPFLCCLCLFSQSAAAFSFVPTEREFKGWNQRCQALYLSTSIGQISDFISLVSPNIVKYWRDKYSGRSGPWHYCEGIIQLQRAMREISNMELKKRHLGAAHAGVEYTLRRMDKNDSWYAEMAVTMGRIFHKKYEIGEERALENALSQYNSAINIYPKYLPAYAAKSLLLKKSGKINEAINLLIEVSEKNEQGQGLSEVHYFLGSFLFDVGKVELAESYANKAYEEGYPLLGLQNKIQQAKSGK